MPWLTARTPPPLACTPDKQFISHSEWTRDFGGVTARKTEEYKRLPFNFCALSLAPFENPVCTEEGVVFDLL